METLKRELDSINFSLRLNLKKQPDQMVEMDYFRKIQRGSTILAALIDFFDEKKPEFVEKTFNENGDVSFSSLRKNVLSQDIVFQKRLMIGKKEVWEVVQNSEKIEEGDVIWVLNLKLDTRFLLSFNSMFLITVCLET